MCFLLYGVTVAVWITQPLLKMYIWKLNWFYVSNSGNILLGKSVTLFKENIPHFLLTPQFLFPALPASCRWLGIAAGNTQTNNGLQSGCFLSSAYLWCIMYPGMMGSSVINSVRCNCYNHFDVTHNKGNMVSNINTLLYTADAPSRQA